jgi:hypothetical protein
VQRLHNRRRLLARRWVRHGYDRVLVGRAGLHEPDQRGGRYVVRDGHGLPEWVLRALPNGLRHLQWFDVHDLFERILALQRIVRIELPRGHVCQQRHMRGVLGAVRHVQWLSDDVHELHVGLPFRQHVRRRLFGGHVGRSDHYRARIPLADSNHVRQPKFVP